MTDDHISDERTSTEPLLAVDGLRVHVRTERETIRAVDGVSFELCRGETVCLIGESGSGKSVTCESLTRLVPEPPFEIVGGCVEFEGRDLFAADTGRCRRVRGDRIAHVFQNPQSALDPVYTVGEQLIETIEIHEDVPKTNARDRAIGLLRQVGIPRPADRIDDYPHEFSGGMCQRVAIAIALTAEPDLVVADEPTTAVDVTVQARLIELLREVTDGGTSLLVVTHDLRVAAALADRLLVMYGGTIVERGPIEELFERPAHPYTQALFESYAGRSAGSDRTARGDVPADGCRFRSECPHAVEACSDGEQPPFYAVGDDSDRRASCVHYGPGNDPGAVLEAGATIAEAEGSDD
ncbi:ABC transporter ATP-binding protein [Natronococcus sp. A-GB1]|uniref:ABC transporter ATP-binding protein n=1 Tax=Natronococcus sp. A-GB1 TaxID=3037648 RepID=UPI00242047F0|nr:ABC transporter ATP-binding protein [Natronococcus sp. A-GB1]MDG5759265.1 ABC transporter ATP-binding protein [Natronococcus sp. A-GB1]